MFFNAEEKYFSLARTSAAAPSPDINLLFEELFGFLLVAGLFREGEGPEGIHFNITAISDPNFALPAGSYNSKLASQITKGLQSRHRALRGHRGTTAHELGILSNIDRLFMDNKSWTLGLSGQDLYGIALARGFSDEGTMLARYVATMFGQAPHPAPASVSRLYLSVFGDIHFAREDCWTLENPQLPYGSRHDSGVEVTALWALLSAQLTSLQSNAYPGETLGDVLANFVFMSEPCEFEGSIPAPLYAASLYMRRVIGIDQANPIPVAAAFWQDFLYGSCDERVVSRRPLLRHLLDLMAQKSDTAYPALFSSNSFYTALDRCRMIRSQQPRRPAILKFALESLDASDVDSDKLEVTNDDITDPPAEDTDSDLDDSTPMPLDVEQNKGMNNIGLLSFDKSGEGADEDLYRRAVVALNDKFKADDTLPVTTEVREALDYWVNGYLYKTAISSTKDYMVKLKLHKILK